ncbi:MAG TPA: hypothetical protein VF796_17885 [Humisphaera sp.]
MGASMTGIIEWTHDAQCAARPELGLALGPPRWDDDDYIHGMLFTTEKEYDFFAAISGTRNRFGREPLIAARRVPAGGLSSPASRYFEDSGGDLAGWLHLSEIDRCIRHMAAGETFHVGFEAELALDTMRRLVAKLSDPHVRLVFNIEG